MYKSFKKVSALALSLVMVFSLFANVKVKAADNQVKINIAATSDLHGRFMPWDYATDTANTAGNLAQVATVIKEIRAANPNTIVVDNGDTIQDNSSQIFLKDDLHPMVAGMNAIGYDTWTLGNHEFNYGVPALEKVMAQFKGKVLAGNVYRPDGSRLAAPYAIIEKAGVKVGIIGMTNPNITKWDSANLVGYKAESPIAETKKAIAELKGKVDVMIGVIHVGPTPEYGNDDGADVIAQACPELAAIVAGHLHAKITNTVNNVLIMEPNRYGDNVINLEITLTKGSDGKYSVVNRANDVKGSLIAVKDYKADPEVSAKLQSFDDRAKVDARTVIGKLVGGDLVAPNEVKGIPTAQIQETAMIKLINDVQLHYTGADVSAAAAFSTSANIKEGDITKAGTSKIYMYDNTLYKLQVTGKQLKAYMEWSATYYNTFKPGDVTISFNEKIRGYNYDMFSGVRYDVDITKEPGSRIVNLTRMNGTAVKDDDVLTLAVNNYRANSQMLTAGVIYKQDDMPKLLEKDVLNGAAVRDLIGKYIVEVKGGIISPEYDRNWKVIGNNWNKEAREAAVKAINEGKLTLPTSFDGRTPNVKSLTEADLMANGILPLDSKYKVIDIYSINDFHGSLKPDGKNIGIAKLAGEIKKRRAANPNSVLVGGGDLFQGSAHSNLLYGKPVLDAMNDLGMVATALGNHEFDWGVDKIAGWEKEGNFEFLAANIYDKATQKPASYTRPYIIQNINGVNVAFIGISTPETAYKTKPEIVANVEFKNPVDILPQYIKEVREKNAEIVIALTHLGVAQDKNGLITGEAADITKVPGLDGVIAAHTHAAVAGKVNGVPVASGYYNGRSLANLKFVLDRTTNKIAASTAICENLYLNVSSLTEDPSAKAIFDKYNKELDPILSVKLGETKVDFEQPGSSAQTNLGEWVADIMREKANAQIGITNGGGLRVPIAKGDITMGKMYELMPFDNTLFTMELTGEQLKAVLENGIGNPNIKFGQVAGVYVQFDLAKPFGQRIIDMRLENGEAIDMSKYYKVVVNDFMATGGDGYTVLLKGKNQQDTGIPIRDAIVDYVKQHQIIDPVFKGYQRTTPIEIHKTSMVETWYPKAA